MSHAKYPADSGEKPEADTGISISDGHKKELDKRTAACKSSPGMICEQRSDVMVQPSERIRWAIEWRN